MFLRYSLFVILAVLSFTSLAAAQNVLPDEKPESDRSTATAAESPDSPSAVPTPSPTTATAAQSPDSTSAVPKPSPTPDRNIFRNLLRDHKEMFSSPKRLDRSDLRWIVPLAATTTALILTDRKTSSWVSNNGSLSAVSHKISYAGTVYASAGIAGGMYFLGRSRGDDDLREAGKLSLEALADTSLIMGVLKNTLERERPNMDSGNGRFFSEGKSFPSGHSSNAWAVATVIACEYKHKPLIRYGAIAAAIAISLSRYTGRAHFMSEVVLGSAIGYGTGRLVYTLHH